MFPNTPEVSQMVFSLLQKPVWLIWSCHKNYLSVRMFQGNFGCHESLRWLFRLVGKRQLCFQGDVLSLYRNFQETFNFLTLISISWYQNVNNTTPRILGIQKFSAFLKLQKFQGNICSFEELFYRKSRWVPLKTTTSSSCIYTVFRGSVILNNRQNILTSSCLVSLIIKTVNLDLNILLA